MGPVLDALERVVGELPGGGEPREGQRQMADAVRLGIAERKHVAVQAGTGTGKTLAYLVPAILSGRRTVVATATKALQDQLAGKDLPFLHADLEVEPSERAWSAVSVSARECPGAARCPIGPICFAEAARNRAHQADVV